MPILVREQRIALLFLATVMAAGTVASALRHTGWGRHFLEIPVPPGSGAASSREVDVNAADAEELCRLPGVGKEIASRIVRCREVAGPFRSPEDLLQVPGIGPRKLEKMRPFLQIRVRRKAER